MSRPKNLFKSIDDIFDRCTPVTETGCWLWDGGLYKTGYAAVSINRMMFRVHRLAYIMANGEDVHGKDVCHKCDVRPCCNPAHLFLGTRKDNLQDMAEKERQPNRKLCWSDVRNIRALYPSGCISQKALGKIYGVSERTIFDVVHYLKWIE